MLRFYLIVALSGLIGALDLLDKSAWACACGVLVGGALLLYSLSQGGYSRPVGFAAPHLMKDIPKRPGDPNANIACAVIAAGGGSYGVSDEHFPYPFRVFYAACVVTGLLIAIVISFRSRNFTSPPYNDPL